MTADNVRQIKWPIEIDAAGCHVWQGAKVRNGYGTLNIGGRTHLAHRYSYESSIGPIPAGLHIDHLCRNRACVNPEHLEPVTQAENNRRAAEANSAHCRRGHERTDENTAYEGGFRRCLACRREKALETNRRYRARHPERRRETQRAYRAKQRAERAS